MKLTSKYLIDCGFECDVEMNLSTHFWKDDTFEIINLEAMDFEHDCDWELIIFGLNDHGYGKTRLIAQADELETVKQLLKLYDINPNNYFK